MFRQIAPRYDAMNHLLSLNIDRRWRRAAVEAMPEPRPPLVDKPILDVCTGTGDLALALAPNWPAGVIGTDFCREMLSLANRKSGRVAANEAPAFLEADSMHLPFADDHFAAVSVAFGLRNIVDTDAGLREMTRVTAPGGRVIVLEFSRPRLPVLRQAYGFYFRRVLPRVGQLMARNNRDAYAYLPQSVAEFPDYEDLTDRMRSAGLVDCRYQPLTVGVATLYTGEKPATEADA